MRISLSRFYKWIGVLVAIVLELDASPFKGLEVILSQRISAVERIIIDGDIIPILNIFIRYKRRDVADAVAVEIEATDNRQA